MSTSLFSETRRRCIERGFKKYPDARTLFQQFFLDARGTILENEIEILTGLYLVWMGVRPGFLYPQPAGKTIREYWKQLYVMRSIYSRKYGFKRYVEMGPDGVISRILFSIHGIDKPVGTWTNNDVADFLGHRCHRFSQTKRLTRITISYELNMLGLEPVTIYAEVCSDEEKWREYALDKREMFNDAIKLVHPEWSIDLKLDIILPRIEVYKNYLRLLVDGRMTIVDVYELIEDVWVDFSMFLPKLVDSGKYTEQDLLDNEGALIYATLSMIFDILWKSMGFKDGNELKKLHYTYFSDISVDPRESDYNFAHDEFFDDLAQQGYIGRETGRIALRHVKVVGRWFSLYKDGVGAEELLNNINSYIYAIR